MAGAHFIPLLSVTLRNMDSGSQHPLRRIVRRGARAISGRRASRCGHSSQVSWFWRAFSD